MIKNIQAFSFSHIGNSRDNHEDNYILCRGGFLSPRARKRMEERREVVCSYNRRKNKDFIVAVSDGMGGHSCGEIASLLTVKYISRHYSKMLALAGNDINGFLSELSSLNRYIIDCSKKNPQYKNMGATLCGIACKENKMIGFNIGDSRLYRFVDGRLEQLSSDHTEGQRLIKLKLLSEAEVEKFPRRKHLYKYIGLDGELIADVFEIDECKEDTVLLLCSDGLTDALSDGDIKEILNSETDTYKKGYALVEKAIKRNNGFGDNITVVLVEVRKGG